MIKVVLLDIDGVLTDGKVTVDADGNETKTIDFKDLDAVCEMKQQGLIVGLLTGENTPITDLFRKRFKPHFFYNGCKDKPAALKEVLEKTGTRTDEVCYAGDGKHDIPIMKIVKFAACPANSISEVKRLANILLKRHGGDGCVWELMEWVSKWNADSK